MYPIWLISSLYARIKMAGNSKHIPPYIQRSLAMLIIFLICISVGKFFVTMHKQEERIEVLEAQVAQLLADTTRLRILPTPTYSNINNTRSDNYNRSYNRSYNSYKRHEASTPKQNFTANVPKRDEAAATTTTEETIQRPRKFTEAHLFDLNTIDSLTLIRIPGIAARTASVILKNRQRYGGFYNPWQLQEFLTWDAAKDYMEEWCTVWFTADANRLRPIHVNVATVSELQRHPYISHEQAVEIVRYRTRHKRLASIAEFQQFSTFSTEQIQQILPYLSFE